MTRAFPQQSPLVSTRDPCLLCRSHNTRPHWDLPFIQIKTSQCLNCGLVYQSPLPRDLDTIYGHSYIPHREETGISSARRATYRWLLSKIPLPQLRRVPILDVGCALGDSLHVIEEQGAEAWGLEYSQALESKLKSRWGERVKIGDFLTAPFPAEFFYAISMMDVIEHFVDPCETLNHCCHLLQPGGWLLIGTPNYQSIARKILGKRWEQFKPEHITYFDPDNLSRTLNQLGLKVRQTCMFKKKLHLGYFLSSISHYSPWLVPDWIVRWAKKWSWLWDAQLWLPTDEFVVLAQKQK